MTAPPTEPAADLYRRGLTCFEAGDYAGCREWIEQALAANPRDSACLALKGMTLIELDRVEEGIESLRLATEIAPNSVEAWSHLGSGLVMVGQPREAAHAYREALRIVPDRVPILMDLSHVLFALDDVGQALETLERARTLAPGDPALLRALAEMYLSAAQPEAALQATLRRLELQPEDVVAHCDAAWLFLQLDRADEAAALFAKLRQMDRDQDDQLYAIHGLVITEIKRGNWRKGLELAIDATRLDRYDFTTSLLRFISSKLFDQECELTEQALAARFEVEHREYRRRCVEVAA